MKNRVASFDYIKFFALCAVVGLHASMFEYSAEVYKSSILSYVHFVINKICRFAVPYFFLVTGYFYGIATRSQAGREYLLNKYYKHFLFLIVFWSSFYFVFPKHFMEFVVQNGVARGFIGAISSSAAFLFSHPIIFLVQGASPHLWFLFSLLAALLLLQTFVYFKYITLGVVVVSLCYLFGLLGGAYSNMSFGLHLSFNPRNGVFFSALFVFLGWYFSQGIRFTRQQAFFLLAVGCCAQLVEGFLLYRYFGTLEFDYSFSTIVYAVGVFLMGLTCPFLGRGSYLLRFSSFFLGVYLFHPFVIYSLMPLRRFLEPIVWDICFFPLVLLVSFYAVGFLLRNRYLKRLVS